jgi:transketolase
LSTGGDDFTLLRTGSQATVIAVGPLADDVIEATTGLDVTVLYAATIRPFDHRTLRATLREPAVVLVEPYLAGTSVTAVNDALADIPHRVLGLGVGREELRRYGTLPEHQRAHGLDPASLRQRITGFLTAGPGRMAGSRQRLAARD